MDRIEDRRRCRKGKKEDSGGVEEASSVDSKKATQIMALGISRGLSRSLVIVGYDTVRLERHSQACYLEERLWKEM